MQLPGDIKLNYFDKENNMQEISVEELTKGKKVGCRTRTAALPELFAPARAMHGCSFCPIACYWQPQPYLKAVDIFCSLGQI